MDLEVFFPGNKKVHVRYKGFVIETDQPVRAGGDETAPTPFDLFLASLAACSGVYVLSFLQQRGLSTDGAGLVLRTERDPETKMVTKITTEVKLPADFPEKYREAVLRAVEQCTVKRHIQNPPAFETVVTVG
ncbi:MAG: OsmC family protein [Thermoleophilia bacterium]|nr:OsmC family protein [Thermoleophilia bacterium]